MSFLEARNVSKSYGYGSRRANILGDINLSIEEGEFVAIIGYSGTGKTTLVSLLAGLIRPDTGSVRLEGQEIREAGPGLGLVFQNYSLLPWLTVYENIALAVDQVFPQWTAAKRREHVERNIALVNLAHARDRYPKELSGGMRQRVSLVRTLAMSPKVLLLDEPLSALDALTRANLQDEISRLWQEDRKTVVLITNDPDEALLLADRVIPLAAQTPATLGQPIPVNLPRPRDRTTLNHNEDFKHLRNQVITTLLASKGGPRATIQRKLTLPDLEPEDLTKPQPFFRRRPIRRSEIKPESIEVG